VESDRNKGPTKVPSCTVNLSKIIGKRIQPANEKKDVVIWPNDNRGKNQLIGREKKKEGEMGKKSKGNIYSA